MSINTMLVSIQRAVPAPVAAARLLAAGCLIAASLSSAAPASALSYPASKTGGTVDDYHGVEVADPYRWLENLQSPDVQQWVEEQN